MAFDIEQDLTAIQNVLLVDESLLLLLDLAGPIFDKKVNDYIKENPGTPREFAERIIRVSSIIKRSTWNDLTTNEKRLCIFFIPDRRTRNEAMLEGIVEINIHVPAVHDYKAREALERVKQLLHRERINKKYLKFIGQLGELPTMSGFYCCGSRFRFYRTI